MQTERKTDQQGPASPDASVDTRSLLEDLADGMHPSVQRARTLRRLDALYRTGHLPDPLPSGFLPGRLLTTAIWGPFDGLVRRIAGLWMPWMGKSFDPESMTGVNRFTPDARLPMRALWPGYAPVLAERDRMEAFEFRNWIGPGAADPDLEVLKIDYDFEANPSLLIRRILDETVQIGDGLYLGKVLYRWRGAFHPIGFFSLESTG
jgi:hypothetical protein